MKKSGLSTLLIILAALVLVLSATVVFFSLKVEDTSFLMYLVLCGIDIILVIACVVLSFKPDVILGEKRVILSVKKKNHSTSEVK
ncbi:MAG: hypothetical protein SOU19_06265 [Candidatus Caccosoma sp.]|nr:hypothetical protein [Candidatus Caccosoma sp.]